MNQPQLIQLRGKLRELRHRWTPDGSQAVIASLMIPRPQLGPVRAHAMDEQPIPLRAEGELAEVLSRLEGRELEVQGVLRRRFYSRDGEERWGQVELWVSHCTPCTPVETDRR